MSGKSTLLRAVGVNVVLALAGAPVRARQLTLSPLAIGATLRVEDSLQAGHSRFYAEILRIRADRGARARGPTPVLFLLDEILHGTNSHDRRIGAEAIVRALVDAGAIGLVTTHDLALTELVAALGPARGQRALRGSTRGRPDRVRLPHAPGRRRTQQRAGADAGDRAGRLMSQKARNVQEGREGDTSKRRSAEGHEGGEVQEGSRQSGRKGGKRWQVHGSNRRRPEACPDPCNRLRPRSVRRRIRSTDAAARPQCRFAPVRYPAPDLSPGPARGNVRRLRLFNHAADCNLHALSASCRPDHPAGAGCASAPAVVTPRSPMIARRAERREARRLLTTASAARATLNERVGLHARADELEAARQPGWWCGRTAIEIGGWPVRLKS